MGRRYTTPVPDAWELDRPDYPAFRFEVLHSSHRAPTGARRGRLTTPHGAIETPAFIFCATRAAIKGATSTQMAAAGTSIILANTYHLMLQPGPEVVAASGGLHRFMGWRSGPMLTDSGGFQVFSLGHGGVADEIKGRKSASAEVTSAASDLVKVTEEGVRFRSHIDGSRHLLTPERSIDIQRKLGADLILVLDECTPFHVDRAYTARSMHLSHRWGDRSLVEFLAGDPRFGEAGTGAAGPQALYGIVQGGVYEDLRAESAAYVNGRPFFGSAIGGSLGADTEQMHAVVEMAVRVLRRDRPIHLLGIGAPRDIFAGVQLGIDTFDCVAPTRMARHGGALVPHWVSDGRDSPGGRRLNLRNATFRDDPGPLEPGCPCEACTTVSRAYLHHCLKAGEMVGITLLTLHNVSFMNRLMSAVRAAIETGTLEETRRLWLG